MNLFLESLAWIFDPANWAGASGIGNRLVQHIFYTGLTIIIAGVIAIAAGIYIGHTGRLRSFAVFLSGSLRALPTLGLLTFLAIAGGFGVGRALTPTIIVLVILAIPPLLAGAYSGVEAIDPRTVDAARAVGMTEGQIVRKIDIPLALPLIIGGIRSATLQVVATASVAAYIGLGGLGRYIIDGVDQGNFTLMLAGSILIVALALVLDGIFAIVQRFVVPRGVQATRTDRGSGRKSASKKASARASDPLTPQAQTSDPLTPQTHTLSPTAAGASRLAPTDGPSGQ